MANNLVLVTHDGFAEGIVGALRLITGEQDGVVAIGITDSETIDVVAARIADALASLDAARPTVVITDIAGGSTTQGALQLRSDPSHPSRANTYFLVGLNLGLLLEVAMLPLEVGEGADGRNRDLLREAVEASKASIGLLDDLITDIGEAGPTNSADDDEL